MILPRRRKRDSFLPWVQVFVDACCIYFFLWFCFWFRFESGFVAASKGVPDFEPYFKTFHFTAIILIFFLRHYGLYRPLKLISFSQEISSIFKAVIASLIVLMSLTFFYRGFSFSRGFLAVFGLVIASGISFARFVLGMLISWIDTKRGTQRNVLVVGCDALSKKLLLFYKRNPRFRTRVVGFLDDSLPKGHQLEGVEVLGKVDELGHFIRTHRDVHEVVVALQGLSSDQVLRMIYECEKVMVSFHWIADVFGLVASRMKVSYLAGMPLLSFSDSPLADWENRFIKRAMDVLVSAIALIGLSPLYVVLALSVKLDSKGPTIYKQQRVGEDGKKFNLLKFRTMRVDAEAQTGPVWAREDDPRRTRIGTALRKLNLDELPQFWNVLKGDMSLVGPRPERPHFVSQFKEDIPRYMARHSIKSGITGWAQVNGLRGNTSIEERTKFDLYYVENWTIQFDLLILLKTILTIFKSPNAY